jgi:hypothetical protein
MANNVKFAIQIHKTEILQESHNLMNFITKNRQSVSLIPIMGVDRLCINPLAIGWVNSTMHAVERLLLRRRGHPDIV